MSSERISQVWWCPPVIPALRRLKKEGNKFKTSLGYIARHYLLSPPKCEGRMCCSI
jgi:hypothetical protein